jgi:divalent metal cation (Fe/Co/Zn/Cd) transporter
MDGLQDRSVYHAVSNAALSVQGVRNPHKMRIRKSNTRYIVDIDIEVDGKMTVEEGHRKAMEVERKVHSEVSNVYDVHVHVEPLGAGEHHERYGLSQRELGE